MNDIKRRDPARRAVIPVLDKTRWFFASGDKDPLKSEHYDRRFYILPKD